MSARLSATSSLPGGGSRDPAEHAGSGAGSRRRLALDGRPDLATDAAQDFLDRLHRLAQLGFSPV
jgi:hypothetical protein